MKSAACSQALAVPRSRLADYLELTKPRIAVMVLFTVAIGFLLGQPAQPDFVQLLHTLCGVGLVAAGASALNQVLERHTDALMRRTDQRPLPAGRLSLAEGLTFGALLSVGGLGYLLAFVAHPLAALVAGVTLLSYVFLYTPLKRWTTLNTLIGAIPGALPPVIGWTAATGRLDPLAGVLFLILFLWQVPHFLAIAWIYRDDYARAGLRMLPVVDRHGGATGRQMLTYSLALIPVCLTAIILGQAGPTFAIGATLLGVGFALAGLRFWRDRTTREARRVLHASLIYLPAVLGLLMIDQWILGK